MTETGPIDLLHQGTPRVIGVYLLETRDGPGLLDCGPSTCIPRLKAGLAERDLDLSDVRHLLLSHIHFDHAGAAGALVREHPGLAVHVSEVGAPHLIDPSRLERSARRVFGGAFDTLWGEVAPVPRVNLHVVGERVAGLECFPSPGHATHHVCYVGLDGMLYSGDAAGVRLQPDPCVLPATPPPDVDLETWARSLDEIERRSPDRLALIHFGIADDPVQHLARMREGLALWAERVEAGMGEQEFAALGRAELAAGGATDLPAWELAGSIEGSYAGLARYWEKKREVTTVG